MKITILNGNPDSENSAFDEYLKKLSERLESDNHTVHTLTLREMNISYCTGCFGCWIKTPGLCVVKDDSHTVCAEYINADIVLFASSIVMGFTSALLKKTNDKLIPLLPYHIEFVRKECHHRSRYEKYPHFGLLMEKENDTDEEDIAIITDIYRRDALNFKTSLCFSKRTDDPIEEVADEINRL